MPELPEVETVKQTLIPLVVGKRISECQVLYPRVLPKNHVNEFTADMINRKIITICRRGKYLLFMLDSKLLLVIHLRMTGQLVFYPEKSAPLAKHTSAVFTFYDGGELRFVDQRKFGTIYLMPDSQLHIISGLYTLGPEPLSKEFSSEILTKIVKSGRSIKSILLDQKKIAGLGNIYTDEVLYRARIHPKRPGSSLETAEISALYRSIVTVLQEAIAAKGTTIKDYRTGDGDRGNFQNKLQVYGKSGEACPTCNTLIQKTKISGRSSHFCPNCQRWDKS